MIAYIRFEDLENRSKTIDKLYHVIVKIQDIKTYDGEPYTVFHVDCIKTDGKVESFSDVLDVMIE